MRRMGKWSLGGETPFCLTHLLEPDRHGLAYFVTMLFLCRQCITLEDIMMNVMQRNMAGKVEHMGTRTY